MARRVLSQLGLNVKQAPLTWARIGAVAGASSDTTYVDAAGIRWRCVQWTGNNTTGLVIAIPGYADLLIASGGGGGNSATHSGGAAALFGLHYFAVGAFPVVVGAGGPGGSAANVSSGGTTSLGSLALRAGVEGTSSVTSSITGIPLQYALSAAASPRAGFGDGGTWVTSAPGSSGCVIARVPA